eukprot:TRINITY_DN80551_c0_g1_i1.p1 TRINITY_DN80551_c0_g1~~TRINITY_DN80551_c0_g1_i1.p1  ORF type:complete len:488 (-),score=114.15 TRINITY_DN80551_c0_g1_i1:150-1613(-)
MGRANAHEIHSLSFTPLSVSFLSQSSIYMFSGAIRLADLDDYIAPSQACVVVDTVDKKDGKGEIQMREDGTYHEIGADGQSTELKKAHITLADCLACSGCVTSAETVLLQSQSFDEALNVAGSSHRPVVVSLGPQAVASLGAHFGLSSLTETAQRLSNMFHSIFGEIHVVDTVWARDVVLAAVVDEFVGRWKSSSGKLPLLCSECPGWVCYAEKTQGDEILPYMSLVRTAQQITGTLLKHGGGPFTEPLPNAYHISVMSCFDKKLEAVREESGVDCVLTPMEIIEYMRSHSIEFPDAPSWTLYSPTVGGGLETGLGDDGSGGFAEHVLRMFALTELGKRLTMSEAKAMFVAGRNRDIQEAVLHVPQSDGTDKRIRFCKAYGFRNIQNLVRQVKRGRSPYAFVEVMACPHGCLNGGGQARPIDPTASLTDAFSSVCSLYSSAMPHAPEENSSIDEFLSHLSEEDRSQLLFTEFKSHKSNEKSHTSLTW